jgi:hypothetical protein
MGRHWGACALAALALGAPPAPAGGREHDGAWARERVRAIRESDTDGWRKIPWSASLLDARRASLKEQRPVFLFTHDGNLDTGRC